MSNSVILGLVQMSMVKEPQKNLSKALSNIKKAAKKGAQIVCLSELFTTLYFPQKEKSDVFNLAEKIPGTTSGALSTAAKENDVILIGGSIFEKDGNKFYNTSMVFDENGKMLGKYRKIHIPYDTGFYEQKYFQQGNLGYKVFDTKYCKIGAMICYDQWYPEAARINSLMGADIVFYPTAIGTMQGVKQTEGSWQEAWENVQRGHAIANGVMVSAVNRVGREGNTTFWGGSFVIDQFGKTLVRGSDKDEILIVKCNLELGKEVKEGWRFFYNRRPNTYKKVLEM